MNRQHATVLVVEDDAPCRSLLVDLLTDAGYSVPSADSGHAARAWARGHRPDLVVLDIQLPDVSGYEICRELRDEYWEFLPICSSLGRRPISSSG